jgi:uncharacterized membrane protein YphA (DoxX/SURF4 family)
MFDEHVRGLTLETICLLTIAGGALLLVGYLTRWGAALVLAGSLGSLAPSMPPPADAILASKLAAGFAAAIAAALICIGPGAYSLDARLFGRHEIVIPRNKNSPPDRK